MLLQPCDGRGNVLERRKLVLLIVASVTMLSGCADVPALLRRHTYPPNFKYITREQLHSAMWQLADNVRALDAVMRQPGPIDAARHAEVERLLLAMRDDTAALQASGRPTNHPLIGEYLKTFQRDVSQALAGVEAVPPSYYLAGSISGACLPCQTPD
jgi:hypothetical protein